MNKTNRCSFCGKDETQVKRMILGPNGVNICDDCTEICGEIMEEELNEASCCCCKRSQNIKMFYYSEMNKYICEECLDCFIESRVTASKMEKSEESPLREDEEKEESVDFSKFDGVFEELFGDLFGDKKKPKETNKDGLDSNENKANAGNFKDGNEDREGTSSAKSKKKGYYAGAFPENSDNLDELLEFLKNN